MDDYIQTNELVINKKKKYAYILLIIVLIGSIICSNMYFKSLQNDEFHGVSVEIESGDITKPDDISGEEINDIIISGDKNISGENNEIIEDISGEVIENKDYYANNRVLDANKPMVALTFDDGPDPKRTIKLLEILKKNNAVASFFDIGNLMEKYPEVVMKEIEAGCDVGGHTYSHINLNPLTAEEIKKEVEGVSNAFKNATGLELKYLRPTYGNANSQVRSLVNMPIINWCVDSLDWKHRNADKVIEEIRKTKDLDGKIILMHVIYDSTLEAVERIIPDLIAEGYQIVTISEMAEYKGYTLEDGKIYYQF